MTLDSVMKAMRQLERTTALICVLLAAWSFGLTLPALSQDVSDVRGANGPIGKEELRERLSQRRGPPVSGYVINGEDLVALLRDTNAAIRLEKCIIEKGLVFRDVGSVSSPIEIKDCELRPAPVSRAPWAGSSIYAAGTRFKEDVYFQSTTFVGPAIFERAEFQKRAFFRWARFPRSANFAGAKFADEVVFSLVLFNHANFRGATFEREASFGRATFETAGDFAGTTFKDSASFRRTVFHATQTFPAFFEGPARFDEAQFEGDALFAGFTPHQATSSATFAADVTFTTTRFGGKAVFSGLTFPEFVHFAKAEFYQLADFSRTRFQGRADFLRAEFHGDANFAGTTFEQVASFQSTNFAGETDFSGVSFADEASFVAAHFGSATSFVSMQSQRFARFRNAVFDGESSFESAAFGESADFQGARFKDLLTLTHSDFGAYANFRISEITKLKLSSVSNPTIVRSRVDLRRTWVAEALLQDVIFENTVDFSDATFGSPILGERSEGAEAPSRGSTILRFVTFENDVSFVRAGFAGRLGLENVKFRRVADFTDARFDDLAHGDSPSFALSYVDFGDLRLSWPQLPQLHQWVRSQDDAFHGSLAPAASMDVPEPISRTLAKLEERFRAGDRLDDSNAAYYHRKRAELHEAREGGWGADRLLREAEWAVWGLISGYGTKIWWAIGWALAIDLIFTLVYWTSATVSRQPHPDSTQEFSFRLRLFDLPKQYTAGRAILPVASPRFRKFIDALRVSSVILFKLGYHDTTIGGHLGPLPMAYVVAVEWVLGFYLLAALAVTLANTQPLINRLISGVF